jgi:hypothetical protein
MALFYALVLAGKDPLAVFAIGLGSPLTIDH